MVMGNCIPQMNRLSTSYYLICIFTYQVFLLYMLQQLIVCNWIICRTEVDDYIGTRTPYLASSSLFFNVLMYICFFLVVIDLLVHFFFVYTPHTFLVCFSAQKWVLLLNTYTISPFLLASSASQITHFVCLIRSNRCTEKYNFTLALSRIWLVPQHPSV